ncbi:indolepyruvate ferredoxin oxidoreductase family protein, partial [Alphaproteobacteria bacterium]|nr:indolepyruvate ferredoxin oxidoreductase family protein [Alphaproteobacteria bacterium]
MPITLEDKYIKDQGKIFVTGSQVLVKLPLVQKKLDEKLNLNTSGFISGYRGSPLGIYDKALWEAKDYLKKNSIIFSPGLNEDLAATAVWGTQQPNLMSKGINDGVFSIWYGKGPGVDRSGDAFKHGNSAGTSANGGVLVLLGDDHISKSSTIAHQSEFAMYDAQIPILNPSNLEDLLNYGIFAWSLSRYSGLWVSMKCITANMDSSASININLNDFNFVYPKNVSKYNVHIKANDDILDQEARMYREKIPSAIEFAHLNNINKHLWCPKKKKIGIISTGKAFADTIDTLSMLGISEKVAKDIGIHLLKVGMSWPLDTKKIETFSSGLDEIIIVEEKRAFLESHVRNHLYNFRNKPKRIVGKFDE